MMRGQYSLFSPSLKAGGMAPLSTAGDDAGQ